MIEMFQAFTEEIDDTEFAVSDVLKKLNLEGRLKKNTLGILHCYPDFIDSGVVKAVCARLPFDVIGFSSMSFSAPGIMTAIGLTISVLTSDDVYFTAGASPSVTEDMPRALSDVYKRVVISPIPVVSQKPAMLIAFAPFLPSAIGGDEFVACLDDLSNSCLLAGIPIFGAQPVSNQPDFSNTYTIYNGEASETSLCLAALYGDVNPIFACVSVLEENMLKPSATVTGSDKSVLLSVNGVSAEEYLVSVGLAQNDNFNSLVSMPFVAENEDGSKLTRTCLSGDGKGGVVLCGNIPVGSRLGFAAMGPADIVKSTGDKLREVMGIAAGKNLLIYSCAVRNWLLDMNSMAEHETAGDIIGDKAPYQLTYGGGEIFPQWLGDGKIVNRFQNDTMIICIL
ncbi:hypothetical protein AGMMS50276_15270 [Synergistales bacterium]|nr:hypothetical protein AGMMS50276_15270 [Synergistales bacterium]